MINFKILTETEIETELENLEGWRVEDGALKTEFVFKDFNHAFAFMSMVALEAEKMDHHPEWTNVYNKVEVKFSTHEAGDKITDFDIKMAKYVSQSAFLFNKK